MPDAQDRLTALEEQVADLRMRLTALEEGQRLAAPDAERRSVPQAGHAQENEALQGIFHAEGSIQIERRDLRWKQDTPLEPIFAASPELLAQLFAALSSPHRVIILRTLCEGPHTSQQLQELLGMASAGQLYHHLKELLAAGLILQRGRSAYTIEPIKVIPICMALMMAFHLTTPDGSVQAKLLPPDQE